MPKMTRKFKVLGAHLFTMNENVGKFAVIKCCQLFPINNSQHVSVLLLSVLRKDLNDNTCRGLLQHAIS